MVPYREEAATMLRDVPLALHTDRSSNGAAACMPAGASHVSPASIQKPGPVEHLHGSPVLSQGGCKALCTFVDEFADVKSAGAYV